MVFSLRERAVEILEDIYDPYIYPWMTLNYFLVFWLFSHTLRNVLQAITYKNINTTFMALSEEKKRNVVTYVAEFIVTSFAFFGQIYAGQDILFRGQDFIASQEQLNIASISVTAIPLLYVWELVYREAIGFPLLIHHFLTLLLVQLVVATLHDSRNPFYLRLALLLGFHATTEQISFVALFVFRLNLLPQWHSILFYMSAIQSFSLKTIVTIGMVVLYAVNVPDRLQEGNSTWGWWWIVSILPLGLLLYAAQVYACYILYILGKRTGKRYLDQQKQQQQPTRQSESVATDVEEGEQALDRHECHESFHRERSLSMLEKHEHAPAIIRCNQHNASSSSTSAN